MVSGLMLHSQMADYFDFLNLHGLKRWHEYQYFSECAEMRGLHRYAINHCNKLICDYSIENPKVIPSNMENYTRFDVDGSTRKNAVRNCFEKWFYWESEKKSALEKYFRTLTEKSKIAEANKINDLICKTDEELKRIARKMIEYKSVDYEMEYILYQQHEMHEHFAEKTKNIGIDIC